jgi:hypothetical protein
MRKGYLGYLPVLTGALFLLMFAVSCKKDRQATDPVNFAKLGLYEQIGTSGTVRRIFIAVSQIGDQSFSTPYGLVFDTGSTGMNIDANGLLPASMITSTGIQVAGDSVTVNGITVTTQQAIVSFGGADGETQEYGNLAYAPVTIGDASGKVTTPRIPIFLYYKVVDVTTGKQLAAHSGDVFGVGPGISLASRFIASPLSYFKLADNITSGFRLAALPGAGFNTTATFVPNLLYIGLTANDLNAPGFVMHPLGYSAIGGYSPNIVSTITYNGQSVNGSILFDTGTPTNTIIENSAAISNMVTLPANSNISILTGQGFSYQYTTASNFNVTEVENPSYSRDTRTIFSINFFLSNEYLLDYTNHRIGLKNN